MGVGVGVGVGVGDGDAEAVTVGVGMGVGEAASSADETEHPVSPVPRTKARATGADFLSSPRRLAVEEDADATEGQENMGGIGGKKGAFTKASSYEKGWWAASREN